MDEKDFMIPEPVPFIAYEGAMARAERTIKRLIIGLILSILMIVVSNLAWLYVWQSYDYSDETVTVDSEDGGNANYIGRDGVVNNGEDNSPKAIKTKEERKGERYKDKD